MIIYIEDLFFEGFVTYFVGFFIAGKLLGKGFSPLLFLVGVIGGGLYVGLPLLNFAFLGSALLEGVCIFLCSVIIANKFFVTFITSFSSIVLLIGFKNILTKHLPNVPIWVLILVAFLYFLIVYKLIRHFYNIKKHKKFEYRVSFICGDNSYSCVAYLDSGNFLVEEGLPVVVIDYNAFLHITGYNIENIVKKTFSLKNAHYINYTTISGGQNMLVFEVDSVEVEGKRCECYLGLNLKGFENNYSALLSPAVI